MNKLVATISTYSVWPSSWRWHLPVAPDSSGAERAFGPLTSTGLTRPLARSSVSPETF